MTGIDPSKEFVAFSESKNPFRDRAAFQEGDAQQLSFLGAAFDNSLSLLVFNFIPDRMKALRELIRVTKPGGCVAAAVWDYGAGMKMLRAFWDAAVSVDPAAAKVDEKHMPLCRSGELAAFWRQGGLQHVEERPLDFTMRFKSFADYWDPFLLGQGPAGAYVKSSGSTVLRNEVKRRLGVKSEDAPIELTARAWAVRGVR